MTTAGMSFPEYTGETNPPSNTSLQSTGIPLPALKSPIKLPRYDGTTLLSPYLAQVQLAARHSGWSDEETATHLALALEGKAVQVLLDLAPTDQSDLSSLTTALQRRFGQRSFADSSREQLANRYRDNGENLGTFAADVQLYAQQGYPGFDAAAQEELALHAFIRGLTPERVRQHVRLASPLSLTEALREAERAEVVFSPRPMQTRMQPPRPLVRMADYEHTEEVYQASSYQVQPQGGHPRPRQRNRPADCCYRCGEPGHIARNCPAPAPKDKVAENYHGVTQ